MRKFIEEDKMPIVANNLYRARKEKGYSQIRLAKIAGIAPVTVCNYESGRNYQKYATVEKIASALEINMEELYKEGK